MDVTAGGEGTRPGPWPAEAGEMAALIRAHLWEGTPLGPAAGWPPALGMAVGLVLASPLPGFVAWGPSLVTIPNDALRPVLGDASPALGRPLAEVWPAAWPEIAPVAARAAAGHAALVEDLALEIRRGGAPERASFTVSCSPIRDEAGGVPGILGTVVETTARTRAEAALRGSEARLHALVAAGGHVMYRMSPDWRRLYQFHGRDVLLDTEAPAEEWVETYIPPEDRPTLLAAVAEAIESGSPLDLEHRVRRADGGVGWVLSRAIPVRDAEGRVVEWFGFANDITERRRADAALRESEERFRSFAEHSADTLWIVDAETRRLEYLSPGYETIWGEGRERVMEDPSRWAALVHPDDRDRAAAALARPLSGEVFQQEYRIVRPDGDVRWIHDAGFPIRDATGRVHRVGGIAQDVTARREAEERLDESRRRMSDLVEGIPQLVWRAMDEGHWTWASPQWTSFTGQPEAASRGLGWLEALHPDDREPVMDAWRAAAGRGGYEAECRLRRARDGTYRWFQTRATPVRDATGQVTEWLGTSTDVDDLRRLERRSRLLQAELQHRVRNTLGVIRSIARRTAATSPTVEDYARQLEGRISAFARVQAAVTRAPGSGLDLAQMIADELLAFFARENDRLRIEGPPVRLRTAAAESVALALHELATNALKHGALGDPTGRLDVTWRIDAGGQGRRLVIHWQESGSALPARPLPRQGYGMELITKALPYQLLAETDLVLGPDGLSCTIALPEDTFTSPEDIPWEEMDA